MPLPTPPKFVIFAAGQGFSAAGIWMQKAALGWLAWELTHSAAAVGAIALSEPIAAFLLAPMAGALTDRSDPLRLIATTQALLLAIPALAVALLAAGFMSYPAVLLLAVGDSLAQTLNHPVRMTIIGRLAGQDRLPRAIATNSLAFNIARVLGPAAAGILMVWTGGTALVFLGAALSYAAMLGVIFALRSSLGGPPPPARNVSLIEDIREGVSYIVHTPRVAALFVLALVFSFLGRPFTELFPAISGQIFNAGPDLLATLMSAQGAGALLGGVAMLRQHPHVSVVRLTFGAALLMSVALIAFSATKTIWIAVALMSVAGLGHVTCNIGLQSLAQTLTKPELRGRIVSLYGLIFRGGPALSAAAIGLASYWIKLEILIGGFALVCGICVLAIAVKFAPHLTDPGPDET